MTVKKASEQKAAGKISRCRGNSVRSNPDKIFVPVSHGEFFDKLTILEIKEKRIQDRRKQANVRHELELLVELASKLKTDGMAPLVNKLRQINGKLWDLENKVRGCERGKNFSDEFLRAARKIYSLNDKRADIKRKINEMSGSEIIEEKEHI